MKTRILLSIIWCCITQYSISQNIDLAEQLKSDKITAVNGEIAEFGLTGVELDARRGDGLAMLDLLEFRKATISIEIQGENVPGRSFVGIAFNIQNDSTYEAVYFRPFNFVAKEPARRSHMAQYIAHPVYTWHKLRAERSGEFEGELKNPPAPDDWFLAKIHITDDEITVYVNDDRDPVLEVARLMAASSDTNIALWAGNGSSGRFRNLEIRN